MLHFLPYRVRGNMLFLCLRLFFFHSPGRLRLLHVVDHDSAAFFDSGLKLRPDFAEAYLNSLSLTLGDILDVRFLCMVLP